MMDPTSRDESIQGRRPTGSVEHRAHRGGPPPGACQHEDGREEGAGQDVVGVVHSHDNPADRDEAGHRKGEQGET